jgi:hypothetical protein
MDINDIAQQMINNDITANWTAFGKIPTEAERQAIYDTCLKIAQHDCEGSLVRIKGTYEGGLIEHVHGDTAYLAMVKRPGEKVPVKLEDLELVEKGGI